MSVSNFNGHGINILTVAYIHCYSLVLPNVFFLRFSAEIKYYLFHCCRKLEYVL